WPLHQILTSVVKTTMMLASTEARAVRVKRAKLRTARAAQLRQIVMNLVVNASDAITNHEGLVRVTTRCVTVGHETAGATSEGLAKGEYVQLEVSDSGSGMSQETQARVFDPFFTTKSAGRGLGLAVVSGIVRSLNGKIRVVSELNKGTTFQILLP